MAITIAIVDDETAICEGVAYVLNETEEFQFVSAYYTAEDALNNIVQCAPDIVIMDIHLPKTDGIECTRLLKELLPTTKIIMFTVDEYDQMVFQALAAGASGYLVKRQGFHEFLHIIKHIYEDGVQINAFIAKKILETFRQYPPEIDEAKTLTITEKNILQLLTDKSSYKKIADEKFISVRTVSTHVHNIYKKLHVHSKKEAIEKKEKQSLISTHCILCC